MGYLLAPPHSARCSQRPQLVGHLVTLPMYYRAYSLPGLLMVGNRQVRPLLGQQLCRAVQLAWWLLVSPVTPCKGWLPRMVGVRVLWRQARWCGHPRPGATGRAMRAHRVAHRPVLARVHQRLPQLQQPSHSRHASRGSH